jgi:hypothetical protein|tara:strand:- start:1671 stop:1916 length:246 start_codon:yes stop_codon:yes gene_type:complete
MKKALLMDSKRFVYIWLKDELFNSLCQAEFIRYDDYQKIWIIRPYDKSHRPLNIYRPKNRPFRAEDFTVELENGESRCVLS